MNIIYRVSVFCLFVTLTSCLSDHASTIYQHTIVPAPQEVLLVNDFIDITTLPENLGTTENDFGAFQFLLDQVIFAPHSLVTKENLTSDRLQLEITTSLEEDAYVLASSEDAIHILGGSDRAVRHGIMTLSQLITEEGTVPIGIIKDQPDYEYRSLMIDLSRNWHSVANLKQLIALAGFYKLKYVHVHLTDDSLFTFPSEAFPNLMSEQHYSKNDFKELNAFAKAYGITLIPEIDMPGHSSAFIRADAKRWAIENTNANYYTLNMGSEQVYEGIQVLLEEVAEAFPESPYIHIGGDEVHTGGFDTDPQVQAYMKEYKLASLNDLYHHFIVRVGEQVKKVGKQPMIWSGFNGQSSVNIPKDFVIMAWDMSDYTPQMLLDDQYTIINASWKPLYVVNNRKWSPETIYNWSPRQWKTHQTPDSLSGHLVKQSQMIAGGSMCAWEQGQYKELISLRKRLAAMSERLWNSDKTDYTSYVLRNKASDKQLDAILFPFRLIEEGLTQGDWEDANRYENFQFEDTLSIKIQSKQEDITVHYTQDGRIPTLTDPVYTAPIILQKTGVISFQAFKHQKAIGHTLEKKYFLAPIKANIKGLITDLPPHSWQHHKFADSLTLTFTTKRKGTLRYTIDGNRPKATSTIYKDPLVIHDTKTVQIGLFDDMDMQIGSSWGHGYVKPGLETSLTTHKPVITSQGENELWTSSLINDGEIARRDHWGLRTNGNNWAVIDLENEYVITRFKTYTYWDGSRFYEYTIDVSVDGDSWQQVVDRSTNREISTPEGTEDHISPTKARFIRLNLLRNSANPSLHLVEFQAFED
ncbi:family 20 glycosylhydrolase [uncultured Dokdonia sp.]|uniref:family 20 glycosylhydrolase n=1 Tax=uncultured Dokdonia sp. TaxID=575653 RepID=UPI0026313F2B|nr:family 20 glycosylhydrolase [uncultured Dokdonia sp.]